MTPCAIGVMYSVIMKITQEGEKNLREYLNNEMRSFVLHAGMNILCS